MWWFQHKEDNYLPGIIAQDGIEIHYWEILEKLKLNKYDLINVNVEVNFNLETIGREIK